MPKGLKGYQKGHKPFPGIEKGWFQRGMHPSSETEFKKGLVPWNKNSIERKCLTCGKIFFSTPYKIVHNRGKYCSQDCSPTLFRKDRKPWNMGKYGYKMPPASEERKCKMSEAHRRGCFRYSSPSIETRRKLSKALSGSKGPAWKGGVSKAYKRGVKRMKYKEWRRLVFIRDDFTCQGCGVQHIYITAHHIKSWVLFPKLRYKVDNGLTLCEECHKKN